MMSIIFGNKRNEVVGDWRKLRNEELYTSYPAPDVIRVIKRRTMGWGIMGEMRNAYKI